MSSTWFRRLLLTAVMLSVLALAATARAARSPTATLVWRGMAVDIVGRNADARPNGERDGRFTVAVTGGRTDATVVQVSVVRFFAQGGYAEAWDTSPGTSASVLGVVVAGRRLNPRDRDVRLRVPAARRIQLELYANDVGVFAPGARYRVDLTLADRTVVTARTVLPGRPATLVASFAGRSEDVVGRGIDQRPNGEPDGRFTVRLDTRGAWRVLEDVSIRRLTDTGAPDVPIWHLQGPQTAAVVVNGIRAGWPSAVRGHIFAYVPLDPARGPFTIETYANDDAAAVGPGWFASGQAYRIAVTFTDTQLTGELSTVVRIP